MCVRAPRVPVIYNVAPRSPACLQFTGRRPEHADDDGGGGDGGGGDGFFFLSINLRHGFSPTSGAAPVTMEATKNPPNWFRTSVSPKRVSLSLSLSFSLSRSLARSPSPSRSRSAFLAFFCIGLPQRLDVISIAHYAARVNAFSLPRR